MHLATRWTSQLLTLGLSLALSQWTFAAAHEAGTDYDRDGVPDSEDWCLNTAPGVKVGPDGCPLVVVGSWRETEVCGTGPTGSRHAGVDADADGVPDSEDWCGEPGQLAHPDGCTPAGVPVDCAAHPVMPPVAVAQPVMPPVTEEGDEDHDGVPDSRDRCPHTPRGLKVDHDGCVALESLVLKGVNFKTGSSVLTADSDSTLDSVAASLKNNPTVKIQVSGHTDNRGNPQANQVLSEKRAEAVRQYLIQHGVAAGRMTAKGYGQTLPVDDNKTPAGRANNRRVELKVIGR